MLHSSDIERFPGSIYFLKVNNRHTSAKQISQPFVHVLHLYKNKFLFVLNNTNFY